MSAPSGQRRLAAVLVADVVGYSRLMEADEAGTLERLKYHRAALIDPTIARHHGRIIKLMGDGALVEFASVVDAVSCAVDIQRAMRVRNAAGPESGRIEFRIGINLGDLIVEGDDLYGDGLNIAARLESLADPGGICVSAMVHQNVKAKLDLVFEDLGEQSLKNIAEPVRAFRIHVDSAAMPASGMSASKPLSDRPSIAVLPFTNMSGDPEQEYFSDGITEDIITELSRFPDLRVIARNSSFAFKGRAVDIVDVGQKLRVAYVVEGSIRRAGNRIRVTGQLIDTSNNEHIWAQRYDRDLADIFAVQDELVRAIAGTIPGYIERLSTDRARSKTPTNMTAFDYLLRGRWALHHSSDGTQNAIEFLENAVIVDPDYATAHSALATAYAYGIFALGLDPIGTKERARMHADRALVLDAKDPIVNAGAAMCYLLIGLHDLADTYSERAYRANSNHSLVLFSRGTVLAYLGRPDEGYAYFKEMESVDPYAADDGRAEGLVDCLFLMGRYEEVIAVLDRWVDLPPHMLLAKAAAYAQLDRLDEARMAIEQFEREKSEGHNYSAYCAAHAKLFRRPKDAERWLEGYRKAGLIL